MPAPPAVHTDPAGSPLLRALHEFAPAIVARLAEPAAWEGWLVREPDADAAYVRLVCVDALVTAQHRLLVGVHLFEQAGFRGRLHDHRWPLAVWPFALGDGPVPAVLYEMPWERHAAGEVVAAGRLLVAPGQAWAIEDHVAVRHAVHSLHPHGSLNLTDVRTAPSRDNRMVVTPMDATAVEAARRRAAAWAPRSVPVSR